MKETKYKSRKTIIDGIEFDSLLESRFYTYFRDNGIKILQFQPRFLLQEGFRHEGKAIRKIEYICDFLIEHQGDRIYIEAKGMKTEAYKIKYKLWLKRYGHDNLLIVAKSIKDLLTQLQ